MALSAGSAILGATTDRLLNKLAYAIANKADDGSSIAAGDGFLVFDASDDYETKYATFGGMTHASTSTNGSTSVEPFKLTTTMAGAGGVGGRAKFSMNTEVVLGGWANALKAEVDFGATGAVTGLGSALVAEMTLGASMAAGTYAPLEIELNAPSGADLGTATSLIYASVNDADADTVNNGASFLSLNGMVVDAAGMFATNGGALDIDDVTHGLRITVNGDDYFLLACTAATHAA